MPDDGVHVVTLLKQGAAGAVALTGGTFRSDVTPTIMDCVKQCAANTGCVAFAYRANGPEDSLQSETEELVQVAEKWDGDDVEPPTEPGCYYRQPNGCEGSSTRSRRRSSTWGRRRKALVHPAVTEWTPDSYGQSRGSWASQWACEGRKSRHDAWCGNQDSEWHFVHQQPLACRLLAATDEGYAQDGQEWSLYRLSGDPARAVDDSLASCALLPFEAGAWVAIDLGLALPSTLR